MRRIVNYIFIVSMLISCQSNNTINSAITQAPPPFDNSIPLSKNGELLLLSTPEQRNTFKVGDSISIIVQNISDKDFTYDYKNTKIYYTNDHNEWIETKNKVIIVGDKTVVVLQPTSFRGEDFDPDINNYNKATYVKIIITGSFSPHSNSSENNISVYIDILLNPK
ncbi:MAG: hypothetical protein U0Z26_18500 [Anaerolineales bacterium]